MSYSWEAFKIRGMVIPIMPVWNVCLGHVRQLRQGYSCGQYV